MADRESDKLEKVRSAEMLAGGQGHGDVDGIEKCDKHNELHDADQGEPYAEKARNKEEDVNPEVHEHVEVEVQSTVNFL